MNYHEARKVSDYAFLECLEQAENLLQCVNLSYHSGEACPWAYLNNGLRILAMLHRQAIARAYALSNLARATEMKEVTSIRESLQLMLDFLSRTQSATIRAGTP